MKAMPVKAGRYRVLSLGVEASLAMAEQVETYMIPSMVYKVRSILDGPPKRLCVLCNQGMEGDSEDRKYCRRDECRRVARAVASGHFQETPTQIRERYRNHVCMVCGVKIEMKTRPHTKKRVCSDLCRRARAIYRAQVSHYGKPKETLPEILDRLK